MKEALKLATIPLFAICVCLSLPVKTSAASPRCFDGTGGSLKELSSCDPDANYVNATGGATTLTDNRCYKRVVGATDLDFTEYFQQAECAGLISVSNSELDSNLGEDGSKIQGYLQNGINLLTAVAGLAITGAVIVGGIQYSTSGGNPQSAANAKKHIGQALLALIALVFLYTFLQWLVPGGIFQ